MNTFLKSVIAIATSIPFVAASEILPEGTEIEIHVTDKNISSGFFMSDYIKNAVVKNNVFLETELFIEKESEIDGYKNTKGEFVALSIKDREGNYLSLNGIQKSDKPTFLKLTAPFSKEPVETEFMVQFELQEGHLTSPSPLQPVSANKMTYTGYSHAGDDENPPGFGVIYSISFNEDGEIKVSGITKYASFVTKDGEREFSERIVEFNFPVSIGRAGTIKLDDETELKVTVFPLP